jgi:hypothetical protein
MRLLKPKRPAQFSLGTMMIVETGSCGIALRPAVSQMPAPADVVPAQFVQPAGRGGLCPAQGQHVTPADRNLAALVEDLAARSLLYSTLAVPLGEFGRSPRVNAAVGRDHWLFCCNAVLAGGAARGKTRLRGKRYARW